MSFVAANVRKLRLAQGLTQDDLAEASKLETTYVARVERGRVNITLGMLGQLADGLGVDPRRLLQPAVMHTIRKGRPRSADT